MRYEIIARIPKREYPQWDADENIMNDGADYFLAVRQDGALRVLYAVNGGFSVSLLVGDNRDYLRTPTVSDPLELA